MPSKPQPDNNIHLSVIAPAYNEADNLPQLLAEITDVLGHLGQRWEVLLVNDGSTDETLQILRDLMGRYDQLRVLSLRQRSGKDAALDAGFRNVRGQFVAVIDADLQNDPADIPRMLELLTSGEYDMVNGWRKDRRDNWLRLLSSRISNAVRRRLTGDPIHDAACGLKLFRRECIEKLRLFTGLQRFMVELVRMEGYRVIEVPVNHRPRTAGKAKYGLWNRVFCALRDAFAVRWMQRRMVRYEYDELER